MTTPKLAKTRIVCVSDTHNQTPSLPKGDVLIHAGDLTNQGTFAEMKKTVEWIERSDFEVKILVAGNHDITLDSKFYEEQWRDFHNQGKQDSEECLALLKNSPGITYLSHESAHIKLESHKGPHTHFSVFGSPYSPAHNLWAFGYKPAAAPKLWEDIPLTTDIVVTHTPPAGHCDQQVSKAGRAGCEELRKRLWMVRPLIHVCGHLHEGRGVEKVRWKDDVTGRSPFLEEGTELWDDSGKGEGNRKQSLVDLTGRRSSGFSMSPPTVAKKGGKVNFSGPGKGTLPTEHQIDSMAKVDSKKARFESHLNGSYRKAVHGLAERSSKDQDWDQDEEIVLEPRVSQEETRQDRAQTCIVNAAIMANNWGGPKRFNKPIVVDIDLLVWEE